MIYKNNGDIVNGFKGLLAENGIKQQFVADKLDISKQSLNLLLNKKHITFDDAKKLIDCIGYDLEINFKKRD